MKNGNIFKRLLSLIVAKGKEPTFFWLLSLSSVDILAFWGHPDLVPPYGLCLEVDLLVCWSILLKIEPEL